MSDGNGLVVTSGLAWRAGELVKLPSGHVAKLRKPNILSLIADEDGSVPDFLMALVMGKSEEQDTDMTAMLPFIARLMKAAFIEPKVVNSPQADDEISLDDVDMQDQMFILNWVMGSLSTAKKFSQEQIRNLAARSNLEEIRSKAK